MHCNILKKYLKILINFYYMYLRIHVLAYSCIHVNMYPFNDIYIYIYINIVANGTCTR